MTASIASELPEVTAADLPTEPWGDRWLTLLGSTADAAMLLAMRLVVDALMMPRPDELPALRATAAPFVSGELYEDPRRFFSFVDAPVAAIAVSDRHRRTLDGG